MRTYSSGRPRVHVSASEQEIREAIEEYERRGPDLGELGVELLEVAADLREELDLRTREEWR